MGWILQEVNSTDSDVFYHLTLKTKCFDTAFSEVNSSGTVCLLGSAYNGVAVVVVFVCFVYVSVCECV